VDRLTRNAQENAKTRRFKELKRRVFLCALDRIRTYDLLLRRQTLYPLSYEGNPGVPAVAGGTS
jgi:hypothetical protein